MDDPFWMLSELAAAKETIDKQAKEIVKLRREVAKLQKATGRHWISVADRLPSEGEWCWVHGATFSGPAPAMYDVYVGWTNTDTWEDFDGEVERWFPIAQPPATEGGK